MDGKIFEADVGSCIRSVPGLKPSQHEIDEIKAYMDRGGTCGAKNNIYTNPTDTQRCDLYLLYIGTLLCISLFPHKHNHNIKCYMYQ